MKRSVMLKYIRSMLRNCSREELVKIVKMLGGENNEYTTDYR